MGRFGVGVSPGGGGGGVDEAKMKYLVGSPQTDIAAICVLWRLCTSINSFHPSNATLFMWAKLRMPCVCVCVFAPSVLMGISHHFSRGRLRVLRVSTGHPLTTENTLYLVRNLWVPSREWRACAVRGTAYEGA